MNALISFVFGVFSSLCFATIIGYSQIYRYLTNSQLLCIGWTISASTAIIGYQTFIPPMNNNLKPYSPEWEVYETLGQLTTPAENASAEEKRRYWLSLRDVACRIITAVSLAALNCGVAEEKHRHENEY